MDGEVSEFDKITRSLGSLTEEELHILERLTWDKQIKSYDTDEELRRQQFSAKATYSSDELNEEKLSFNAIKQAIEDLNPAEIAVLNHLLALHLDKTHQQDGQHISASWGSTSPLVAFRMDMGISTPGNLPSLDPESEGVKRFEELVHLIDRANAAKAGGDKERALALIDEAMRIAEQAGMPSYQLERMRELFR